MLQVAGDLHWAPAKFENPVGLKYSLEEEIDKCYCLHLGTAYIHGIQHATGNYVIIMDADLSHHVSLSSGVIIK